MLVLLRLLFIAALMFAPRAMALESQVSGYAHVVAGVMDDAGASYAGFSDELSLKPGSVLGLQGQLLFDEQFSLTTLAELHSDGDQSSGIDWLYLKYQPSAAWQIKVGQMQTPFYSKSDVLNVGYAYPWVQSPREVYIDYVFDEFQGIDVRYSHYADSFSAQLEMYYGQFDGELGGVEFDIPTKVDDLRGMIAELQINAWRFRGSYHTGLVKIEMAQVQALAQSIASAGAGFDRTVASLALDGSADFYQLGLEYSSLSYFALAEWSRVDTENRLYPNMQGYYFTLGRYLGNYTVLFTYGQRKDDLQDAVNDIPTGVDAGLDALSAGYDAVYAGRESEDVESWTLGLRWDFRINTALKAEYKNISSHSAISATFREEAGANFDQEANMLFLGLEWVF